MISINSHPKDKAIRNEEVSNSLMNSELGAIAGIAKYGIPRAILNKYLINTWHIPEHLRIGLSNYFILKWESSYLTNRLMNGLLRREDKFYYAIFHDCSLRDIANCESVKLSFRVPQPEYKLSNIVLISTQSS